MGLLKGRATMSRYLVSGETPPDFWDFIDRRIRANVFQDIEQTTAELSVGWVSIGDFMDTKLEYMSYALDPYVALGLRVDQRKVPAALLKKYHRLEVDKAKSMLDDGGNIGRSFREELKDKARLELLTRIPPASNLYEVIWNTANNELWLGASSAKVRDMFQELFVKTFGLDLIPRLPFLLARDLVQGSNLAEPLEEVRPWGPLALEEPA